MITLTATINLLEGQNASLTATMLSNSNHRISSGISSVVGVEKGGKNPFFLGKSKLGESGSFVSNKVNYFIGDVFSDSNGKFTPEYKIYIQGNYITNLTFIFDKEGNQHPLEMKVNGETVVDDDNIWTISNIDGLSGLEVIIPSWNTPNAPLKLTGILAEVKIKIDSRNLTSLDLTRNSRGDIQLPSWGIISNSGEVSFNDTTGEILDYIDSGLLREDIKINIQLTNTISKKSEIVGTYKTTEWNYDNDNRQVSVRFGDELLEWQDTNFDGIEYDPRNPTNRNGTWFYNTLYSRTIKNGYKMRALSLLDTKTRLKLSSTTISYPIINSGSLWSAWRKFCEVFQLYIYQEKDGTINCVYGEN